MNKKMRLLILTQAVDLDDPVLGFFHRWIEEFATHCGQVQVVCLKEGRHALPPTVHVHSLGKESGASRIKYVLNFYRFMWELRSEYDAVFVHMNPEYVVLGGWWWKLRRKRIALWYVHRQVTWRLRVAARLVDAIFTSTPESLRLITTKAHYVGHGIDVAVYQDTPLKAIDVISPRVISVGRITPIKHLETIIRALRQLRVNGILARLDFVGDPVTAQDSVYKEMLLTLVRTLQLEGIISFRGSIKNSDLPQLLAEYDFAVNAGPTGGIDKAVLESTAKGMPTFVANEGFRKYFDDLADQFIYPFGDAKELAQRIVNFCERPDIPVVRDRLQSIAREKVSISHLVDDMMKAIQS